MDRHILFNTAINLLSKNINVIGVDENKRAFMPWKKYQSSLITFDELEAQCNHEKCYGIAVMCGAVSNNLEVIDIDVKYDLTGKLYADYSKEVKELTLKLPIVQTRTGGYHFYYRCEIIEGNQKLAQRAATEEEKEENPNDKVRSLIETRGEAGYVVAPPTDGYQHINKVDIPVITIDEREFLFETARRFNTYFQPIEKPRETKYTGNNFTTSPFEDFNNRGDAEEILLQHNWKFKYQKGENRNYLRPGKKIGVSGSYHINKKCFYCFSTSSEFEALKPYSQAHIFCVLKCNNNWSETARQLIEQGYGEKKQTFPAKIEQAVFKKKQEGMSREELISFLIKEKSIELSEATETIDQLEKQWGPKLCTFWERDSKGKVSIIRNRLEKFLCETGGFYLYFYDSHSTIFRVVRIVDGVVEEASIEQIKKFIKEYIYSLPNSFDNGLTPDDLIEIIYKGQDTYFSKGFLEFLPHAEINFLNDTANEAFFPFSNGIIKVTKAKVSLQSYKDIKGSIWKSQIIDFKIDIEKNFDWQFVEFIRFIEKVCNDDLTRVEYLLSIIGYILHKYKDPTKPFSPIFCEETEKENKGGGTGKGILNKSISRLLPTIFVDGQNFNPQKPFAWQRVGFDTKYIVIDDCPKNFNFQALYSCITEGLPVERKNKDELYLSYEDSPKIGCTTNYAINNTANHAKRRQRLVEFSGFFTPAYTPEDFFKHRLFDDWDADEWNRFYNLMFQCVQVYLKEGIHGMGTSETLKKKQINQGFGEDFFEWFTELCANGCSEWHVFADEYQNYLKNSDLEPKDYSKKRFKAGLQTAAELFSYSFEEQRNRQENGKKEFRLIVHDSV